MANELESNTKQYLNAQHHQMLKILVDRAPIDEKELTEAQLTCLEFLVKEGAVARVMTRHQKLGPMVTYFGFHLYTEVSRLDSLENYRAAYQRRMERSDQQAGAGPTRLSDLPSRVIRRE